MGFASLLEPGLESQALWESRWQLTFLALKPITTPLLPFTSILPAEKSRLRRSMTCAPTCHGKKRSACNVHTVPA